MKNINIALLTISNTISASRTIQKAREVRPSASPGVLASTELKMFTSTRKSVPKNTIRQWIASIDIKNDIHEMITTRPGIMKL